MSLQDKVTKIACLHSYIAGKDGKEVNPVQPVVSVPFCTLGVHLSLYIMAVKVIGEPLFNILIFPADPTIFRKSVPDP